MEYPKIETVFDRDEKTFKVKEDEIRLPEFSNVKNWWVTEKIDGTNIRVIFAKHVKGAVMGFKGRTGKAQIPQFLLNYLETTFTIEKFEQAFPDLELATLVILYGEGYGPKINKGHNYREDVSFRLFDVKVGDWWLEPDNIKDVATKLGIQTVPTIGVMSLKEIIDFIKSEPRSLVARYENGNRDYPMEGIVARSHPLMFRRNGERIIWKLKQKDFP